MPSVSSKPVIMAEGMAFELYPSQKQVRWDVCKNY